MCAPIKGANEVDAWDERFEVLMKRIESMLERAKNLQIKIEKLSLEESTDQNAAGGDVAMEVDVEETEPTDTDAEDKANGDSNV